MLGRERSERELEVDKDFEDLYTKRDLIRFVLSNKEINLTHSRFVIGDDLRN